MLLSTVPLRDAFVSLRVRTELVLLRRRDQGVPRLKARTVSQERLSGSSAWRDSWAGEKILGGMAPLLARLEDSNQIGHFLAAKVACPIRPHDGDLFSGESLECRSEGYALVRSGR